eukprot:UN09305
MWRTNGGAEVYGNPGGGVREPFKLNVDEYVVEIQGRQDKGKLAGIQFLTSKQRQSEWFGKHTGKAFRFKVKDDEFTIVGLKFDGIPKTGVLPRIIGIEQERVEYIEKEFKEEQQTLET